MRFNCTCLLNSIFILIVETDRAALRFATTTAARHLLSLHGTGFQLVPLQQSNVTQPSLGDERAQAAHAHALEPHSPQRRTTAASPQWTVSSVVLGLGIRGNVLLRGGTGIYIHLHNVPIVTIGNCSTGTGTIHTCMPTPWTPDENWRQSQSSEITVLVED